MRELRHPVSAATYGLDPDTGLVRVTDGDRVGLFTANGEWRSGARFDVDPQMCIWIGGPNPPSSALSFRQV